MNKSPKILILGFGSVMNFGGEAIVQGTCELLREIWPYAPITIAAGDTELTKKAIVDFDNIEFVIDKPRFTLSRILKGFVRRIGIGSGEPLRYNQKLIDEHDIFLSVGGDIFVEQITKQISLDVEDLMQMGYRAKKQGKIYCLWGASVGPFSDPSVFANVAKNLRIADLITVREDKGYEYLKTMGCTNMVKVGDPAFMMKPKHSGINIKTENETIVGINLSRLAMNYIFGVNHTHEDFIKIVDSVRNITKLNQHIKLVLIPHVMSSNGGAQDDYQFLSQIKDELNLAEEKVILLPYGLGSQKTKDLMQQCDVVVSARMHCFVGSVSTGTPALMIAYSDKGYGMTRYVYGNENWVLGLDKLKDSEILAQKVNLLLEEKAKLEKDLIEKREVWKNNARIASLELQKIYERKVVK